MKLSNAEWQIMNALWKNAPATARQVSERLPKDVQWAYTTIKTMLTRLAKKKVVKETKRGNVGFYEPLVGRDNAQRTALKSLVNQAFDGAFGPLMHFLVEDQKLTGEQRAELLEMLQENDSGENGHE